MKRSSVAFSFTFSFLCLFFAAGCASVKEQPPLWAEEDTLESVYPSASYIARVGRGDSVQNASAFADAELTRHFEHSVTSLTSASQTMTSGQDGTTTTERTLNRKVLVDSSMQLFAVHHTDSWYDAKKKRYVVCSYIDRQEAFTVFESRIQQAKELFDSYYKNASSETNPILKTASLKDCKAPAENYLSVLNFAHTLMPSYDSRYADERKRIASVDAEIAQLKNTLVFYLDVKGDSDSRIKAVVSKSITDCGYKVTDSVQGSAKNSVCTVNVNVLPNKIYHEQTITANPSVEVKISGGAKTVFSYSRTLDRITGFKQAEAFVDKKIYDGLEGELKASLTQAVKDALN